MTSLKNKEQKRHKCFDDTHRDMIETAVRLISEKGLEALSVAAVLREMGLNRTTFYYHFENRDSLIDAVKDWSAQQLAKAFEIDRPQHERIDYISRFVLENPELIKLWIEDLISVGDIRSRYPHWDNLVEGVRGSFLAKHPDETIDAEVYCVILLTSAIIGPRVFKNSVDPKADVDTVVDRFRGERQRMLKDVALLEG